MAASRAIRRLLDVLEIQEEECRAAMASARAELIELEQALVRSVERERGGRRLVIGSMVSGEVVDRVAGLEEVRTAKHAARALMTRIAEAEDAVEDTLREFLAKRIERRQTESLIEQAEAADKMEAERRAQKNLDEWFLRRRGRA